MLKIRLQRTGRKNVPTFRIVLTDSKNSTKSGKFIEVLGNHDPRGDKGDVKADKVKYWMSQGAQLTGTLHNLFIKKGIIKGEKVNKLPKNIPAKAPEPVIAEKPATSTEEPVSSVIPAEAGSQESFSAEKSPDHDSTRQSPSLQSGPTPTSQSEESSVISEEVSAIEETPAVEKTAE
jgi:small subunit ribosomal protein S16